MSADAMDRVGARTRRLLACGAVAGPLFVAAFLVEGTTRGGGYDPLRHPVSSLALGDLGWTQTVNFLVAGLLTVAFAVGVRHRLHPGAGGTWGPLLLGAWGGGLVGAGLFVTDPVSGYPAGSADRLVQYSTSGALHDLCSFVGFAGLVAACFVLCRAFARRGEPGLAVYSALTGVAFAVGIVLASAAFGQAPGLVDVGGLIQRLTIAAGWAWVTVVALDLLRERPA
jgi:hypothetical protein